MEFTEGVDQHGQPVKHPRPQHTAEYLNGVYRCGQRGKHEVRIHRANWPPQQHPNLNDKPHVEGVCENCGGNVQIYDPPDRSITVVLYGDPADKQGRVVEEGQVLDEAEVPVGGAVVDEEERPSRKGRR
jgi:hypothetical protein